MRSRKCNVCHDHRHDRNHAVAIATAICFACCEVLDCGCVLHVFRAGLPGIRQRSGQSLMWLNGSLAVAVRERRGSPCYMHTHTQISSHWSPTP
eukprot:365807-Chlamydomonas_euryale.AAC.5